MIFDGAKIRRRLEDEGSPLHMGESTQELLSRFAEEVRRWGVRTHLVGKSNIEENIMTSLLDSLHLLHFAEQPGDFERTAGKRCAVADIGSGAGFPGMVWAIARPEREHILFERRERPRLFLERTVKLLGLEGHVTVEGEAERSRSKGGFDIVVSRAAGRLDVMLPAAGELLSAGGLYVTVKGDGWREEMAGMENEAMRWMSSEQLPGGRGVMLRFVKGSGRQARAQ